MSILSRRRTFGARASWPWLLAGLLGWELTAAADGTVPAGSEPNSPDEMTPGLMEPGLLQRAVPTPVPPPAPGDLDFLEFHRLQQPLEETWFPNSFPAPYVTPDPSEFRPVVMYAPPLGLQPQMYRHGLLEFYPWAGLAQSFESNVQLTSHHPVSDFFASPRIGLELQLGTPDSVHNEYYDTVLAAHVSYEGYADLFYENSRLDAFNQRLDVSGRIGRDRFKVRPFFTYSDITGSNLQLLELQNRVERLIANGGVAIEADLTPVTGWRQTYTGFNFQHVDPAYINYDSWTTRQELTHLLADNVRVLVWAGAQTTSPDKGFGGNEYSGGVGYQGQFSSQWESELWLGWGELDPCGHVPTREDLSGIRYHGHTIFDWTPRVRLTLDYYRTYAYNEQAINNNYVATLTQLRAEFYLAEHWLVTPFIGTSLDEYETSRQLGLEVRPEVELSYIFAREDFKIISIADTVAASRVFLKLGYDHTSYLKGGGDPVDDVRISTGVNWNF